MSNVGFSIDTAQIVALFMESVTYGVFLTTFLMCLHGLLYSPTHRFHLKPFCKVNYCMLIAALLMFTFASLDVAFGLCHNINAFVTLNGDGNGPENAEEVFNNVGNWINVMKFVDYVAQTFIGDSILIYRCYLVWDRTWYVIIPSAVLCIAETVCGCMVAVIEASPASGGSLNSSTISPFITSMLSITLATTILTTTLIVYRLWNVQHRSQTFLHFQPEQKFDFGHSIYSGRNRSSHRISRDWNSDPLARAMKVMVESGLLYTLSLAVLFAVFMPSSNAELGVSDSVVQIIVSLLKYNLSYQPDEILGDHIQHDHYPHESRNFSKPIHYTWHHSNTLRVVKSSPSAAHGQHPDCHRNRLLPYCNFIAFTQQQFPQPISLQSTV
ncbi:hypothetical protein J3R30DRAFT_2893468 [Lentinula aciculospora]|uniref:Uncharacterized protein n=1 Tax=Lentinula aciculospora TaxID=153920 RepID=A0A9W9AAN9_9AGAR|nr:hypothetical protein J3R30DRAFT_2893468 [Lentinula aciculospora]